ncbi:MAG TPA: hypothetical protein VH440_09920, partial [Candidatus Limnocylindrales bacterium]
TAAVDQPRYGPNGAAVATAIDALRRLSADDLRRIAAAVGAESGSRGGPPWPPGLRPDENDALRVSSELARRDAAAALPGPIQPAVRRSVDRAVHAIVLRHAFPAMQFDQLVGPWREPLLVARAPRPGVRANRRPRG